MIIFYISKEEKRIREAFGYHLPKSRKIAYMHFLVTHPRPATVREPAKEAHP
jgi:hypothetical protein